jgi:glycerol-3-phosphate acyltransferase PlsX
MGGDFAPEATVKGAINAQKELHPNQKIVLIGDKSSIVNICEKSDFDINKFEIVHTTEVISMGDHPARSFTQKTDSSIVTGFKLLKQGTIQGFASIGNTGAMLVGGMQIVKSIPGVIRPCITAALPKASEKRSILLDVGINVDCKPDVLYQYAILGSIYAEYVHKLKQPKVGLLNIGSEEEKGNLLTKTTYQGMKESSHFNFIGNVEANEIFSDDVDVIVCDGFVGNVMLKEAEAFYMLLKKRKIDDPFWEKFNFVNYGGTPILGINKPVVIGHGISNETAIKNMILHTFEVIKAKLSEKITEVFT